MSPDSAYLRDAIAATAAPLAVRCDADGVFTISHVHAGIVWIRHGADDARRLYVELRRNWLADAARLRVSGQRAGAKEN